VLVLCSLGLAAGCSFSVGSDWPPLSDPAETRAPGADAQAAKADAAARMSLAALAAGEPRPPPAGGGAALVGRVRPLAVIRFGAGPVGYEAALYGALRGALERRPATAFDLVAVAPELSGADQVAFAGHLEQVFRALIAMGLPAERLSLSALALPGVQAAEVHVYVR
jgi:hypothetical protein